MLETSKDVLNIVLAVSVFGVSFFISWALYYLVMTLRQLFKTVEGLKAKIDKVDEAITAFKDKIESSSSYLLLLGEGVKKLVDVMKRREKRRGKEEE